MAGHELAICSHQERTICSQRLHYTSLPKIPRPGPSVTPPFCHQETMSRLSGIARGTNRHTVLNIL